eukprot:2270690-Pleurochrysis_carterae.AAC.1
MTNVEQHLARAGLLRGRWCGAHVSAAALTSVSPTCGSRPPVCKTPLGTPLAHARRQHARGDSGLAAAARPGAPESLGNAPPRSLAPHHIPVAAVGL